MQPRPRKRVGAKRRPPLPGARQQGNPQHAQPQPMKGQPMPMHVQPQAYAQAPQQPMPAPIPQHAPPPPPQAPQQAYGQGYAQPRSRGPNPAARRRPAPPVKSSNQSGVIIGVSVGVIALIGIVVLAMSGGGSPDPATSADGDAINQSDQSAQTQQPVIAQAPPTEAPAIAAEQDEQSPADQPEENAPSDDKDEDENADEGKITIRRGGARLVRARTLGVPVVHKPSIPLPYRTIEEYQLPFDPEEVIAALPKREQPALPRVKDSTTYRELIEKHIDFVVQNQRPNMQTPAKERLEHERVRMGIPSFLYADALRKALNDNPGVTARDKERRLQTFDAIARLCVPGFHTEARAEIEAGNVLPSLGTIIGNSGDLDSVYWLVLEGVRYKKRMRDLWEMVCAPHCPRSAGDLIFSIAALPQIHGQIAGVLKHMLRGVQTLVEPCFSSSEIFGNWETFNATIDSVSKSFETNPRGTPFLATAPYHGTWKRLGNNIAPDHTGYLNLMPEEMLTKGGVIRTRMLANQATYASIVVVVDGLDSFGIGLGKGEWRIGGMLEIAERWDATGGEGWVELELHVAPAEGGINVSAFFDGREIASRYLEATFIRVGLSCHSPQIEEPSVDQYVGAVFGAPEWWLAE